MKKIICITLFLVLISSRCLANVDNSFIIDIGNKPSQIGFQIKGSDNPFKGPVCISNINDNLYILDEINSKINVYSLEGQYKETIEIPKEYKYYYLSVDMNGTIKLLTNQGIYCITNNEFKKIFELPPSLSVPYYIFQESDSIILVGLSKKGLQQVGKFESNGDYSELKGYRVITNSNGIIGLQSSEDFIDLIQKGKNISKINIKSTMVPFGLSKNLCVYCVEPLKKGLVISKLNKKGVLTSKKIKFHSLIFEDDISVPRYFNINEKGQVIVLEVNEKQCKVSIINL